MIERHGRCVKGNEAAHRCAQGSGEYFPAEGHTQDTIANERLAQPATHAAVRFGRVCETIFSVNPRLAREARFEQLLDTYAPALRRLCAAQRRDPQDRQDLFQDIAVALWNAIPQFRGDSSERTWLYRIAHNVALTDDSRRQSKRRREVQIDEHPAYGLAESPRRAELLDAVQRLDPIERQLALLYLEGLSTREIGDVLGITEGNTAVRLTRMRQRLTQMLNPGQEARRT